jgi:hypothetical protein
VLSREHDGSTSGTGSWISQNPAAGTTFLCGIGKDEVDMRWCSPSDSVSWTNLLAKGMAIAGIRFDLGYPIIGLLSSFDALAVPSDSNNQVSIRAQDPWQHQAALQDGYIGVRLASDGAVIYQRLSSRGMRPTTSMRLKVSQRILNRLHLRERALFIRQKVTNATGFDQGKR